MRILFSIIFFPFLVQAQNPYQEPWRPQFHFTPPANWMNDPNGMVYLDGEYHLFYQYYPDSTVWGPMHWGHAASTDLYHWEHLPIALYPDSLGMIFSGSAVVDEHNTAGFGENALVAIYTYHNNAIWEAGFQNTESQGIAYSLDKGRTWTKYAGNPVLHNSGQQDFRDPKVFWYAPEAKWVMTLAIGDHIGFFSSPDLKNWTHTGDFSSMDGNTGLGVWECPDLFPMQVNGNQRWVLLVNHGNGTPNGGSGTRYFVGDFDGFTFTATQPAVWLDEGTDFYAAVTWNNAPDDQRILLAWMSNWMYAQLTPTVVWRSAMTLPRKLSLRLERDSYRIYQEPVTMPSDMISMEQQVILPRPVNFQSWELPMNQQRVTLQLDPDLSGQFGLTLSNNRGEHYNLSLSDHLWSMGRKRSGEIDFSETFPYTLQTDLPVPVFLVDIICDESSVEIFINGGQYSYTQIYFPGDPYTQLLFQSPKDCLQSYLVRTIGSAWP